MLQHVLVSAQATPGCIRTRGLSWLPHQLMACVAIVMVIGGCQHRAGVNAVAEASLVPQQARVIQASDPGPARLDELPTTDGNVFARNIEAQLQSLREKANATDHPHWRRAYTSLLYFQTRLTGRLAGFKECENLISPLLAENPNDLETRLLAARISSAMHRFDDSRRHLDAAQALGANPTVIAEARSQLALALGDTAEALRLSGESSSDTLTGLAYRGNLAVLAGDLSTAERLFRRAELRHRGTSPYPLSWLHVQHGIALLRNNELGRAKTYFEAAHKRLPSYYLAAEHLAETELRSGNFVSARKLYEDVFEQTQNPEFLAQLAHAEDGLGLIGRAEQSRKKADQMWQVLLADSPAAYWQHAAKFYLNNGDTAQAVRLARSNIALRGDVGSWLLLAETELAAGNVRDACRAWKHAADSSLNPPELAQQSADFHACDES